MKHATIMDLRPSGCINLIIHVRGLSHGAGGIVFQMLI